MLLKFSNWLAFEIFKLAEGSRIGEALSFFYLRYNKNITVIVCNDFYHRSSPFLSAAE